LSKNIAVPRFRPEPPQKENPANLAAGLISLLSTVVILKAVQKTEIFEQLRLSQNFSFWESNPDFI
jgi:hypothetical protein